MQIGPNIDRWSGGGLSQLLWNIVYSFFISYYNSMRSLLFLLWFLWLAPTCCHVSLQSSLCCSGNSLRQLWCGVSHMYHEQTQLISMWPVQFYSLSVLMSPQAGVGYSRWPWFPLLCTVAAASAGYSSRCSQLWRCQTCALCSSVCVKVMLLSFKKVVSY